MENTESIGEVYALTALAKLSSDPMTSTTSAITAMIAGKPQQHKSLNIPTIDIRKTECGVTKLWWFWATNNKLQTMDIVNIGCTNDLDKTLQTLNAHTSHTYKYLALFRVNNIEIANQMIYEMFNDRHINNNFFVFHPGYLTMNDAILNAMKQAMHKNYELFSI